MSDIQIISLDNGRIALQSPYHPDIPSRAKNIGGRWNSTRKQWTFDARDESAVRDLAREIYGTDGSQAADLVTIRVGVDRDADSSDTWFAYGRQIAHRRGRDEQVRLGEGVVIVEGGFPRSGGSVKYPQLRAESGTVLEIRDVPRTLVVDGEEIVGETLDIEGLRAERERLAARIAEIDALLA